MLPCALQLGSTCGQALLQHPAGLHVVPPREAQVQRLASLRGCGGTRGPTGATRTARHDDSWAARLCFHVPLCVRRGLRPLHHGQHRLVEELVRQTHLQRARVVSQRDAARSMPAHSMAMELQAYSTRQCCEGACACTRTGMNDLHATCSEGKDSILTLPPTSRQVLWNAHCRTKGIDFACWLHATPGAGTTSTGAVHRSDKRDQCTKRGSWKGSSASGPRRASTQNPCLEAQPWPHAASASRRTMLGLAALFHARRQGCPVQSCRRLESGRRPGAARGPRGPS
jgi:hypothetical protein